MRNSRPPRTLLAAMLIAATAFLPATGRGDEGAGWRATRGSRPADAGTASDDPTLPVPSWSGSPFSNGDDEVAPITYRADREPAVSTWSRIRRADLKASPCGVELPALQTAEYAQPAQREPLRLAAQFEAAPPAFPPDAAFADDGPPMDYTWQILPAGLLYRSYMAGEKEARLGTVALHQSGGDTFQESTLGARVGIIRYGTPTAIRPEGWELDFEGAAFLRQNWDHDLDVDAVDFRYGIPLTWRRGPLAVKFGFYHLSSHAGDEFLIRNPGFQRINYIRDSLLLGVSYNVTPDWRLYGEVGYAVNTDGGAEPWELQFGAEYSPIIRNGWRGSPFFAANGHLRQEFDFGGSLNVMAGWQWRSNVSDHVFRVGAQYYNGKSLQWEFFNRYEQMIGGGVWFDF